jgi:hypothetical protein
MALDELAGNRGRDREHGLVRLHGAPDLREQALDVLGLDRDHDNLGALHALDVGERGLDPVALPQIGEVLLVPRGGNNLLGPAPAGRQEARDEGLPRFPGAQDGDAAVHPTEIN